MHGMMLRVGVAAGHITAVASQSITISRQYQPSLP